MLFFIYSSIEFNMEQVERKQKQIYICGEGKQAKACLPFNEDCVGCFQTKYFFKET